MSAEQSSAVETEVETALRQQLAGKNLGALLDIGCGDGGFLDDILDVSEAEEVWGIDPDENAISEAKSYFNRTGPDIPYYFFTGGSPGFTLPREKFDTITFQDMLHHLNSAFFEHIPTSFMVRTLDDHLKRADELLNPGGLLICSELIAENDDNIARRNRLAIHNLKARVDSLHGISHSYSIDAAALEELMNGFCLVNGFDILYSSRLEVQSGVVKSGRADRAVEETLEYFERYIQTLKAIPSGEEVSSSGSTVPDMAVYPEGMTDADTLRSLETTMQEIRKSAMDHGLLAQRRLLFIARKQGAKQ